MENTLSIIRTHVSFGETQYAFLNACSDHPIQDGFIFSKVFTSDSSLTAFLQTMKNTLSLSETFVEEVTRKYSSDFFAQQSLVLLFSDERSGSNRLTLRKVDVTDGRIHLEIERERGLTMDMAYLFLFYPLNSHAIHSSSAHIANKQTLY